MTLVKVEVIMMFRDNEDNQYDDLRNLYFLVDDETANWVVYTNDLNQEWLEEEERFLTKIHKAVHEMPDYDDYNNWCIGEITREGQFSARQGRTVFNR
jgi:hypothetical protein